MKQLPSIFVAISTALIIVVISTGIVASAASIPCLYDSVGDFSEGFAWVEINKQYGFIDLSGELVIPLSFEFASSFCEGRALIRREGKYGFIDRSGAEIIPPSFDAALPFREGLARVGNGSKYGFIGLDGDIIIELMCDSSSWQYSSDGLVMVVVGNDRFFYASDGQKLFAVEFDEIGPFDDGLAFFRQGVSEAAKYGYLDRTGAVIVLPIYDFAQRFYEGLAVVCRDGMWGYINSLGQEVIPPRYEAAVRFSEGLAAVAKGGKTGFIDYEGHEVLPFIYDVYKGNYGVTGAIFNRGLAMMMQGDKLGLIDRSGRSITGYEYAYIDDLSEGMASAIAGSLWGYLNTAGVVAVPLQYNIRHPFHEGLALVGVGNYPNIAYGYVDCLGNEIIAPFYSEARSFNEGMAAVKSGSIFEGKWGFVSKPEDERIIMVVGSDYVTHSGAELPKPPQVPQIISGRVMLPFRYLVETILGGAVDYDAATRCITAKVAQKEIIMVVDEPIIYIDGEANDFGQAPLVIEGSTLVPLRAFQQVLSSLTWHGEAGAVALVKATR